MLNLHSMCAAHVANLGKTSLLFWFPTSCIHLPTCLCFLDFFRQIRYLFFFMKLVPLVSHICHFCVHFYQHQFNFQTDSTAAFHSKVLVKLELFLCLYSLFVFLNRRLMFWNTVYCTSLPVWISVYKFLSQQALLLVGSTHLFYALDWHHGIVIISAFLGRWRSIQRSRWLRSDALPVTCQQITLSSTNILNSLVLLSQL